MVHLWIFTVVLKQSAHSLFTTVVDSNELGLVYPFQLKQLKYQDPQDEGAVGATMDFMVDCGTDIHIMLKKIPHTGEKASLDRCG